MLAVVPVRDGALPAGAAEVIDECAGRGLLIGTGVHAAAEHLSGELTLCEAGAYRPATWARALATHLAGEQIVVLPGSPDGRDLGPRLAALSDRPFYAGAVAVAAHQVMLVTDGGRSMQTVAPPPAFVATLQPGVRGATARTTPAVIDELDLGLALGADDLAEARCERVDPPDPATIDLAEASRIVAAGAGLTSTDQVARVAAVGEAIGASLGATRVVTDRGWVGHERQIGTTGVVVAPELYLAFGISGAVQHTSGLGHPDRIISVNVDAHCPMMQLADLAVVADANAVLDELVELLGG